MRLASKEQRRNDPCSNTTVSYLIRSYASSLLGKSKVLKLNIVGWREGLLKISMSHVLQERLSLGLKDAKDCVDDVLAGRLVSFTLEDLVRAELVANA